MIPARRCRYWWLAALLFLSFLGGSSPPKIIFRVHVQSAAPRGEGAAAMQGQVFPVFLSDPEEQIYVSSLPELSERDVLDVMSRPTAEGLGAVIKFNAHGRTVLSTFTANNRGRVMVIFVNGRVIYAPVIDTVLGNGEILIPRGLQPAEITLLKQAGAKANKNAPQISEHQQAPAIKQESRMPSGLQPTPPKMPSN